MKRPNGRPRKQVTVTPEQMVEVLASRMCPTEDIAIELGIARSTLWERFPDSIKRGHARARNALREAQTGVALGGNAVMLIWLGKQYLGQTDKLPELSKLSDAELIRLVTVATRGADGVGEASGEDADATN